MTSLPFASLCNRYAGRTGWVVGRGPTRFRYEELAEADGPIFFINDAVGQEKWLRPGAPSFFFAHDGAMEGWLLDPLRRSVPVLISDRPVTGPPDAPRRGLISGAADPVLAQLAEVILYRGAEPWRRDSLLDRSRTEIRDAGQLYTASGTIHPLLHFAWYVGCAGLKLVGCDGYPGTGYDRRLENRSRSAQQNAVTIRLAQDALLRKLSLPAEYLGAGPHRVALMVEIRAERADRAGLLGWSDRLAAVLRASGCVGVAVDDRLAGSGSYWITGAWPEIDSCVGCLASAAYQAAVGEGERLRAGDPDSAFRVAFNSVP